MQNVALALIFRQYFRLLGAVAEPGQRRRCLFGIAWAGRFKLHQQITASITIFSGFIIMEAGIYAVAEIFSSIALAIIYGARRDVPIFC